MTGAGLEEEGALEAGVAAMSSILGMKGLPREQAAVANLMTGMVKAMGSIACLSEVRCRFRGREQGSVENHLLRLGLGLAWLRERKTETH